jgi:serine/threonine protein phosphatase 1
MSQGRVIAVGDIHGCAVALSELLRAIAPSSADCLVTLGDYIDRGPDSRQVIDILQRLSHRCWLIPLLGNHDKMLLSVCAGKDYMMSNWMDLGGAATLASFECKAAAGIPEPYIAFLQSCRRSYETSHHLFVHANYLSNLPLEEQPLYVLRWESLKTRCPGPHYSGKTAIVGHTAQKTGEILDLGHVKCIDTWCYGGGWLTAMDVCSGQVWQINQQGCLRERQFVKGGAERDWGLEIGDRGVGIGE